ncbi:hypothetical protein MMAD_09750 [Mycolicibacterium madagascariense]|uniref:Sulfur globule protein n=1 Tax=Mycolicibacterium madagascariense TaxID=212765 RepID=A0A7I7XBQ1_9MYCO|nr:hypothetical protein [Mycolicibacterium madagascariense]MCV7011301.1 hypothetical protein [Mycolicibacterium madagascariense]BBZ26680.1 hypothetical protein MMAD_09750 [Mycolicibacterium madagascariense]
MFDVKKIAAGAAIAGSLGLAALGAGAGVANADPYWGHGHGWGGPAWGGYAPPPPPPYYGYGGYNGYGGGCVTGPLGLLHFCN